MAYFGGSAKPFSHKIIENINRSSSENCSTTLLDPTKVKIKDISKGENLYEAPEDGRIDTLSLAVYHEKSSMLVEKKIELHVDNKHPPALEYIQKIAA